MLGSGDFSLRVDVNLVYSDVIGFGLFSIRAQSIRVGSVSDIMFSHFFSGVGQVPYGPRMYV